MWLVLLGLGYRDPNKDVAPSAKKSIGDDVKPGRSYADEAAKDKYSGIYEIMNGTIMLKPRKFYEEISTEKIPKNFSMIFQLFC